MYSVLRVGLTWVCKGTLAVALVAVGNAFAPPAVAQENQADEEKSTEDGVPYYRPPACGYYPYPPCY
jgi:hypothetical protein